MSKLHWKSDRETYQELQKLKRFVNLAAGLEYASEKDKKKAIEINRLIESIDKPETFQSWNVCIDIMDYDIQGKRSDRSGLFWKRWWAFFDGDLLEIESASNEINGTNKECTEETHFHAFVCFEQDIPCERINLGKDINEFVEDALNFRSYLNETFKYVEVEIDVGDQHRNIE